MKTTNLKLEEVTPEMAINVLKHGNFRFLNNIVLERNMLEIIDLTKHRQSPFAAILSCMDSRTSAELVFDQGFGDIFSIRIAGNVLSENVLGSLEYATASVGSRLIVVLGHTNCGAIKGACEGIELGHLTNLLQKIRPSVQAEQTIKEQRNGENADFVNAVSKIHACSTAQHIIEQSVVIRDLVLEGKVGIIPALYDVSTGKVNFFDQHAIMYKNGSPISILQSK
jgi:carbonic anhydrase